MSVDEGGEAGPWAEADAARDIQAGKAMRAQASSGTNDRSRIFSLSP
jgi:hypothetical protein